MQNKGQKSIFCMINSYAEIVFRATNGFCALLVIQTRK